MPQIHDGTEDNQETDSSNKPARNKYASMLRRLSRMRDHERMIGDAMSEVTLASLGVPSDGQVLGTWNDDKARVDYIIRTETIDDRVIRDALRGDIG